MKQWVYDFTLGCAILVGALFDLWVWHEVLVAWARTVQP